MPLIEWNETFATGIKKIDEQHRKFFSLINVLFDAMKEGKGEELVDPILKELQAYVVYHFHSEESWMKLYHYPDTEKHIWEHQEAMKSVQKLVVEFDRGDPMVIVDMLKFLSSWLQSHILETDRKYIPYLRDKI